MSAILIIEDEAALASALGAVVRRLGHEAVLCASAALGMEKLAQIKPALVILDIGLPDRSGLDVLQSIRAFDVALPVLIVTAHGSLANAMEAKNRGASGYLVKPLDLRELEDALRALLQATPDAGAVSHVAADSVEASLLIGSATSMQPAFAAIAHATASDAPVLISGPTGIGKSLAARIIHRHSRRHAGPFITLSCASLPETLLEAELFGHEKGAFTGAAVGRPGHIERAAGGTLFLDEIAEISPSVQVKLLRFVEEKIFTRVGGREDLTVDLRIIAATNQDIIRAMTEKRFREDLYYRLRVLEVRLPSLKERLDDLSALGSYLLAGLAKERPVMLSKDALDLLMRHDWPGNVRELRNALEHAVALCGGTVILPQHLPVEFRSIGPEMTVQDGAPRLELGKWLEAHLSKGSSYEDLHGALEAELLSALLPRFEDKPTLLARALDMNRATLRKKLRDAGLSPDHETE